MLTTSACDQDRPALVFAHIALQVQIMLRICFNRGNRTCVFGFGPIWGPLARALQSPLVDTKDRRSLMLTNRNQWPPDSQNTLGKVIRLPQNLGRLNLESRPCRLEGTAYC